MGFLSKLGLTYDDSENQEVKPESKPNEQSVTPSEKPVEEKKPLFAVTQPIIPGQIVGEVDPKLYQSLSEAIEKQNLPGNDFLEFMMSLNNISSLAVDEKTKFVMVFTTLNTTTDKVTKEKLLSSIDHYLGVIENEKSIFQSEMDKATAGLVTTNENRVINNTNDIQAKLDLIVKTQQEIAEMTAENQEITKTIEENKFKIAKKEADFSVTSSKVIQQITEYKSKIEQYI